MPGFKYETEMSAPAKRWLASLGLTVKSEFALPWGICDLVGVELNSDRVQGRLALGQIATISSPARISILQEVPDKDTGRRRRVGTLIRNWALVAPRRVVEQHVEWLVQHGFVERTGPGTIQRLNGWEPLHRRLITLELKMERAAEALRQAEAHRAIGGEAFVGLPGIQAEAVAESPRQVEQFRSAGVGLLAVDHRSCRMLLAARCFAPSNRTAQMHCLERFWREHVRGS